MRMENIPKQILGSLIVVGGLWFSYRMISTAYRRHQAQATSSLADESPEVRQAMTLRSAMNPSGVPWLAWGDGTHESIIDQIARQITKLDSVVRAYKNLYQRDLITDLQKELNSTLFNAFMQTIASNKVNTTSGSSTAAGAYTQKGRVIVARQKVVLRTEPDASYQGNWWELGEKNTLYRTAQAGEMLGYATGKQHFDSKNNVKFMELAYRVSKHPSLPVYLPEAGKTIILWVSASSLYTEQFDSVQAMLAKYPANLLASNILFPVSGLGEAIELSEGPEGWYLPL